MTGRLTSCVPLQLVNYAQFTQTVALRIRNSPVLISATGNVTVLTGEDYRSTNSFEDPYNVRTPAHTRICLHDAGCAEAAC